MSFWLALSPAIKLECDIMNIPGFTAEASLRSTTNIYRATANIVSKPNEVQMQWLYCYRDYDTGFTRCCRGSDDHDPFAFTTCYRVPPPELFPESEEFP
jgi:hypothetical protein